MRFFSCFRKDWRISVAAVGIWSLVYSIVQSINMSRQIDTIQKKTHYRDDRFFSVLLYFQAFCLLSAIFLFFSSISLIYGIWKKRSNCPWFICIFSSILSSLAYCITWSIGGSSRDEWAGVTIYEMITVIINIYCVKVVATCHRRLDPVEKIDVRREINTHLETIKGLLEHYEKDELQQGPSTNIPFAQSILVCPTCPRPEVHKSKDSENANVSRPVEGYAKRLLPFRSRSF